MLAYFNPDLETWVKSNPSNYVVAAILLPKHYNEMLRPVAFISKKIFSTKYNNEIYDKELLTIIQVFEEWRSKLVRTSIKDLIYVITDSKNLEYFIGTKDLNRRQA